MAVFISAFIGSSLTRKQDVHQSLVSKCSSMPFLHVIMETDIDIVDDAVRCVSRLMDVSECPIKLHVHIIEPVNSVKANDVLGPALEKACKMAPKYSTYFNENVNIYKLHVSRNLRGAHAVQYILNTIKTLEKDARVLWIPSILKISKAWDEKIHQDLNALGENSLIAYPLAYMPMEDKDIERFFLPETLPKANFFGLGHTLDLHPLPMIKPAMVDSIGISQKHAIAGKLDTFREFIEVIAKNNVEEDLASSFLAYCKHIKIMHGKLPLGFKLSNPNQLQKSSTKTKKEIIAVSELEECDLEEWLQEFALGENFQVFGRALLGMTSKQSLEEVFIKWGSEATYETEKEALQYG